jgi:hypothetical protein
MAPAAAARWARAGLAAGLAAAGLAGLAGLAGCAGPSQTEAYCQAISDAAAAPDAAALIGGDEAALAAALDLYQSLAELAPASLKGEWGILNGNLEAMLQAARGDRAVEDSNYDKFSAAYAAIEQDKRERCPQAEPAD